ncbi:MAG: DJ-1/PfpI family protein [Anaerolineae bacterium]|nr:DJ-1/PfpI family protein [Anaerolineae bacterium]
MKRYVLVLWGDKFEETAATIFVSELRKAGLRVKVVGLTRQQTKGAHGLGLIPDITLEQALSLAGHTACIILPCALPVIQHLKNDPRLHDFFIRADANQARFVLGQLDDTDLTDLGLALTTRQVLMYPESEDLIEFAREVASSLLLAV